MKRVTINSILKTFAKFYGREVTDDEKQVLIALTLTTAHDKQREEQATKAIYNIFDARRNETLKQLSEKMEEVRNGLRRTN